MGEDFGPGVTAKVGLNPWAVAAMVLTTESIVTDIPEPAHAAAPMPDMHDF